jgi:predicted metal-dependent phosphotriesterase family hydrolase
MSHVRTVLGDIAPDKLGVTYCHEHLITLPGEHLSKGSDDMTLDDLDSSAAELELFAQAGGRAVVELSAPEYGRDAAGLAELSRRTGVHVIAATGHIMEGYWRGVLDVGAISDQELRDEMLRDLTEGFGEAPDVRAGVIKVGTGREVHPDEERMLRLAAQVQQETGAPISTHTTAGNIPLEQVRIFQEAGADPAHTIIGHQDRRLVWEDHLAIVEAGFHIGYDCVSKEQYERDLDRIDFIKRLIAEGYADRICLSGDIARRSYMTSYGGGPGFTYILWRFVPWLWQSGVSREDTDKMLIHNPARLFAWANGAGAA